MNEPLATQFGYIAFLGAPNAGKSTLFNALLGQKLAIVTPKAQTTRSRITGVVIEGAAQIVLVDVPGVFEPSESKRFERAMVNCAWSGAADADLVAVMIDARRGFDEENIAIIERLAESKKPAILILNKIDLIAKERLLDLATQGNALYNFEQTFMISALKGQGLDALKKAMAKHMPAGVWHFPEDYLTDLPERLIASEITRETLFMRLRDELPYALAVETEKWETKKDGSIKIDQIIYVEREGQKGIILGKNGAGLKAIGQAARGEIGRVWGCPIHLFLFVKVRENWKSNPEMFSYMGLEY